MRKVQLVLSDGDNKIYDSFDEVQKTIYPQSKHGLCIYHIVTQKLSKLSLLCADEDLVKDQVGTFKRWLFSWMTLGGVETEEEYQLSKTLMIEWLESFRDEPTKRMTPRHEKVWAALKYNSTVFEDFSEPKLSITRSVGFSLTEST